MYSREIMPETLNSTLIDGISLPGKDRDHPVIDIGAFIENLILFDTFVLKSNGLKEFPPLVRLFGFSGVQELLKSNSLRLHCEMFTIYIAP